MRELNAGQYYNFYTHVILPQIIRLEQSEVRASQPDAAMLFVKSFLEASYAGKLLYQETALRNRARMLLGVTSALQPEQK
jgi:hypothetical protein